MRECLHRIKLRNCISSDTYRYYFSERDIAEVWQLLRDKIGGEKILKAFRVKRLENLHFIISHAEGCEYITIIKKPGASYKVEQEVLNLIGFKEEGRD